MGDFNARIQRKLNNSETPVGPHTFDKMNDTFGGVDEDNRVAEKRNS